MSGAREIAIEAHAYGFDADGRISALVDERYRRAAVVRGREILVLDRARPQQRQR